MPVIKYQNNAAEKPYLTKNPNMQHKTWKNIKKTKN